MNSKSLDYLELLFNKLRAFHQHYSKLQLIYEKIHISQRKMY